MIHKLLQFVLSLVGLLHLLSYYFIPSVINFIVAFADLVNLIKNRFLS
jgi:hypothetical protein